MMSEDLFFNKVKETMHGYSPEVSAEVYGAMRKKYARSKFFSWNASSLNVWYVALVAVMGLVVFGAAPTCEMQASKAATINMNVEHLPASVEATPDCGAPATPSCEQSETVLKHRTGEPSLFPSSLAEVKEEAPINQNVEPTQSSTDITTLEEEVNTTESIEAALPEEEKKQEVAPTKPTRKIRAPRYKDKQ